MQVKKTWVKNTITSYNVMSVRSGIGASGGGRNRNRLDGLEPLRVDPVKLGLTACVLGFAIRLQRFDLFRRGWTRIVLVLVVDLHDVILVGQHQRHLNREGFANLVPVADRVKVV